MRIEYLYFFLDVAETLSISKSARRYFISPQGLSRAIRVLEDELQVELFDRFGNNLTLSKAGCALLDTARDTIHQYELLTHEAQKQSFPENNKDKTDITIFATSLALNNLFPLFNKMLLLNFPRVHFQIIECTHDEILESAYTPSENHLYLVNMPTYNMDKILSRNDIIFQPLLDLKLLVVAARNSAFAREKIYTHDILGETPIAYYNEPLLEEIIFFLLRDSSPSSVILKTTNLTLLNQVLQDGQCVSLTDDLQATIFAKDGLVYLPLEDTVELRVGAIYTKKEDVLRVIPEIVQFINHFLTQYNLRNYRNTEQIASVS